MLWDKAATTGQVLSQACGSYSFPQGELYPKYAQCKAITCCVLGITASRRHELLFGLSQGRHLPYPEAVKQIARSTLKDRWKKQLLFLLEKTCRGTELDTVAQKREEPQRHRRCCQPKTVRQQRRQTRCGTLGKRQRKSCRRNSAPFSVGSVSMERTSKQKDIRWEIPPFLETHSRKISLKAFINPVYVLLPVQIKTWANGWRRMRFMSKIQVKFQSIRNFFGANN